VIDPCAKFYENRNYKHVTFALIFMKTKTIHREKVNIITLGCSKNMVDSEVLSGQLKANEINVVHESNKKDHNIVIVNTCGFIEKAKEESINTILQQVELKRRGKLDKVYVTGCLSERYKNNLEAEIPEVDAYFGTMELPFLLKKFDADYKAELIGERLLSTPQHYAYLKISEGCNRTCSFCPNSLIDRITEPKIMPEATWSSILTGLREVRYNSAFVWSRYSEALSERRILERIREVRDAAPASHICVNSNGDFLDGEYLEELEKSGLDRLWIDLYIPDSKYYNLEEAKTYHKQFLARIGRKSVLLDTSPELTHRVQSKHMEIFTHVRNIAVMTALDMSGRAGLISFARKTLRTAPCYAPYKHLVVDWDGSVVVCCEIRSDSPSHREGVVGKIGVHGIGLVDAYVRLAEWRASLRTYGPKKGPCASCNVEEYPSTRMMRLLSNLLAERESPAVSIMKTGLWPILRKRRRLK